MQLNRRDFLRLTAAGTTLSFLPSTLRAATPGGMSDRVLVVLYLNGGNDAVNTVIPYADRLYRSLRPTLALTESSMVMLDGANALHPALAPLQPFYASRRLALVNGVGFPSLDRSHFHCRDVWMTGDPGDGGHHAQMTTSEGRGWLGRYADLYLPHVDSPLTTVALGSQSSLALDAQSVLAATVAGADGFDVTTDSRADEEAFVSSLRSIYDGAPGSGDLETIRQQGSETFAAIDLFRTVPPPSGTVIYPESALGRAFRLAAQIIDGNVGTHAVWINHGGFDTHAGQAGDHASLLTDVAGALAAFQNYLAARAISQNVVVMVWSEFGRRVQENASQGTDHGKAGTMMLLGDAVNGGSVVGGPWNLAALDEGDLESSIDFRAVYATLIRDWYGNDPIPVLGGDYENLGLITNAVPRRRRRAVR